MRASKTFLLLAGLFTISNGLPSSFQCARYCKEESDIFGYELNKVYSYNYEGDVRSLINTTRNGAIVDESGIKFKCSVDIHVLSTCEYAMQISRVFMEEYHVRNTVVQEYPVTDKFQELRELIESKPLYFSYHTGKISTICPDADENNEILAIKKGILSVFQNSMQDLKNDSLVYETDIAGTCETVYKILSSENEETVVEKTKNLDACSNRMSQYLSWQSVPYAQTQAKSLPLLRSTLSCTQVYNEDDLLKSSTCEEKHVFQPFSNGDNGALSLIKQNMRLQSIQDSKAHQLKKLTNFKRTSLIYAPDTEEKIKVDVANVLKIFKELDGKTVDGVEADVPVLFSRLVFYLKNLNEETLLDIFSKITQKQKKFYIDAISLLTTTSGIQVMKTLYVKKLVSKKQMDSWIVSLNFIKNPDLDTIAAVKPLMKMNTTKQSTYLAVSNIIHRYCKRDPNCILKQVISETIREFEQPLENNCVPSGFSESNDILLSLKALGNAGLSASLSHLHQCYSNRDSPLELRLAAIAAHRRISCTHNFNLDDFKKYFANPKENTEIRIASYLAIMQCASYAVFAQVKDVLMKEETNQVGSFVWTHVTNLQESSVKWKQGIRKLLENEFLRNKFNTDVRKYSRNYEASTFFDSVGAGCSMESNVIFTSESYLPRSAMLNFTLDLFGETVNVFEFGGRIEGFEDIVENIFGPEGYFSDKSIKTFLENARSAHNNENEEIQKLHDDFKSSKVLKKDPAGSLYAKIFGNEISYTNFKDVRDLLGDSTLKDNAVDILLKLFKENDIEYVKSFIFLDSSYKVPTILGFPLELQANGTSTLGLTVKGKLDLKNLLSYKVSLEGKIYPSASIRIVGKMTVDGIIGKSGVQYIGSLNSNTYLDGHAVIDAGKLIDVKLNIPKKQMDIISVSSDVMIITNNEEFKIQNASDDVEDKQHCTHELFSKITGLQICQNIQYVNASLAKSAPNFPLTGSFKYAVNIKKTDTFDNYQLHIQTQTEEQTYKPLYSMMLYLDTPNSIIDRKISASYNLNLENLSMNAKLESPFTNFEINSRLGNDVNKYSFELETSYNKKEIVSLQSSFNKNFSGETFSFDSEAKLNYRKKQIAMVTGSLNYLKRGHYAANLQLGGITKEPVQIIGDLFHDPKFMKLEAALSSPGIAGDMKTEISILSNYLMISSDFNYTLNSERKEKLSLLATVKKVRNVPLLEDSFYVKLESTQKPIYNLHIELLNQRKPWFYKNHGLIKVFETNWESNQIFKFTREKQLIDFDINADLVCKERNIDYRGVIAYNKTKHSMTAHGLMQLTFDDRVEVLVDYKNKDLKELVDLSVYYPRQSWDFNGSLLREDSENYIIAFNGFTKFDGQEKKVISIAGEYTNSSVDMVTEYKINCTLDFPEARYQLLTPWIITASLQKSNDLFISYTQLKTRDVLYVGHVYWVKDSFKVIVQSNEKQLFVLEGAMNQDHWRALIGLNIYQHFELRANLQLPFEHFEMLFYWDKERDESKKFNLGISRNSYKGLYKMNMEYPNQQILAGLTLLPTQVTMNVTWGLELSKRIYLKVGNKVYDVGGYWYGELETPFRYLEKQEFTLKYLLYPSSFEVQSDIAWRRQNIKLLISGSKSTENLTAVFQLNTTMPDISQIGANIINYRPSDDNFETVASFVYNKHQINGKSMWKLEGEQVRSDFLIESPTNTIQPIGGFLGVNTIDNKSLVFEFKWLGKVVNVACKFKPDTSTIVVNTPFEGFENTTLEYNVKSHANSVSVAVTFDLLKQYNNIDLKWSHFNESMVFFMDITSPVTGYYSTYFTHSTISGVLKECFTIKGHGYKDLVLVKLEGEIKSISDANIATNLQLLDHKANIEFSIENDPIVSTIKASWDDFKLETLIFLEYKEQQINSLLWSVNTTTTTNLNTEDNCIIYMKYYHLLDNYVTYIELPKGYILENTLLMTTNYEIVENKFNLTTPDVFANLNYKHEMEENVFKQELVTVIADQLLNYSLYFDGFSREVLIKLDMPYQLKNSSNRLKVESIGKLFDFESSVTVNIQKTNEPEIKLVAFTNFTSPANEIGIKITTMGSSLATTATANFGNKFSSLSILSKTTGNYFNPILNAELVTDYTKDDHKISVKTNALFNRENYNLEGTVMTGSTLNLNAVAKKGNKYVKLEASLNSQRGNAVLGYNIHDSYKKIRLIYNNNNDDQNKNCFMALTSNLEFIPKYRLNTTYSAPDNKVSISFIFNEHSINTNGSYIMKKGNNVNKKFSAALTGSFFVLYTHENNEKINLDMKLTSSIECNLKQGKLFLATVTNLQHFEKMEIEAEYVEMTGYEAWAAFKHNNDLYRIDLNNFIHNDVFEISSRIETPKLGLVKFEMNTLKKYSEYTTQIILNINEKIYSADVITSYVSNFATATRFQINTFAERYTGNFEIKLGDGINIINLTLALPDNVFNRFTFNWDLDNKPHITSDLQIDYIQLPPQKIILDYDFGSANKTFTLKHFENSELVHNVFGNINSNDSTIRMDKNGKPDFIVIGGTHKFNSLKDFSLSYVIYKEGVKTKVDVLNYFGEIYQTKLDIISYIRGWNRITLESKLDDNKIRISFNIKNHRMSLIAKKLNSKGGDILTITFQGETLLEILSAAGQVTLTTSTRFGKYRFFIQYNQNPGIYIFTILKNRENLISIMLQNLSTNFEFDFKGKLIAPELIPAYSNLSLQFHADRDISKSAHFRIFNPLNELFEIKWFTKVHPTEYTGYFKFNSMMKAVQNIELYTVLDFAQDLSFSTKFTLSDEYYISLLLPKLNKQSKFNLRYPCVVYRNCEFVFDVNPRYLNFYWTSPFEQWQNVSLKTHLQYESNLLSGELRAKKADAFFDFKFLLNALEEFVNTELFFNTNTGYLIEIVSVNGKYYYHKLLNLEYESKFNKGVLKAVLDKNSLVVDVINDGDQICNITLMDNQEQAFFGVNLNNVNIISVNRGKIENKEHTQYFKANSNFLLQFDGYVYYDLYSPKSQRLGGYFNSNETSFFNEINLKALVDIRNQFNIGKAEVSLKTKDINETGEVVWFFNFSIPNVDLSVNFTRNDHIVGVKLMHDIDSSSINSALTVACGERKLALVMRGEAKEQLIKGMFNLITPIPALSEVNVKTIVRRLSKQYHVYNYISWPDQFIHLNASAVSTLNSKKLDIHFSSSFAATTTGVVEYKKLGKKAELIFETMTLNEWIMMKSEITPWSYLNTHLNSSFEGFKTCGLTYSLNQNDIIITGVKENMTMDMKGVYSANSGAYDFDMEVNYPNGEQDIANAYILLRNNNINMTLKFKNDYVKVNAGLDNNLYNLYIQSPYPYARDVNIKGVYNNDVNIYNLESDGHWNELVVNFRGTLNTINPEKVLLTMSGNAGDAYSGQMNFTCNTKKMNHVELVGYFPKMEYYTYIKFQQENNEASIIFKSPFDRFSSLNIKSIVKKFERVDIFMSGNILGKQFVARNAGSMNSTDINGSLLLEIPELDNYIKIEVAANEKFGNLILNQNSEAIWNNVTIKYDNSKGRFNLFYTMSGRWNVDHTLRLLYIDGPNVEYGLILNNNQITEHIIVSDETIITRVVAKIPTFGVNEAGFYLKKYLQAAVYNAGLYYNEFKASAVIKYNKPVIEAEVTSYLPYLGPLNLNSTYTNNDEKFDLLITLGPASANIPIRIFTKKDASHVILTLDKIYKLELQNADRLKFFILLRPFTNLNILDMEVSDNLLFIKAVSPIFNKINVEIILNKFQDSNYKQFIFYYKEQGVQKYSANFTYNHLKQGAYIIETNLNSKEGSLMHFETILNHNDYTKLTACLNSFGEEHTINATLSLSHPYVGKIDIISPKIRNNRFTLEVELTSIQTMTFYVGSGEQSLGNYILFQSLYHGKSFVMNVDAPKLNYFKLFTLNLIWDFEIDHICTNNLRLESDALGDITIKADFKLLDDLLDIETLLEIPFLENLETFYGKIYIPTEFRPQLTFIFPKERTYSLHFNHSINSDLIFIDAGFQCADHQSNIFLNLSKPEREIEGRLRLPTKYYAVLIKKEKYMININNDEFLLSYKFKNEANHKLFDILFTTPIEDYETTSLNLEYKTLNETLMKVSFYHPSLEREAQFMLTYESLLSFELVYNIHLPITINNFDFVDVIIMNKLNPKSQLNVYILECMAVTNNYSATLYLEAVDNVGQMEFIFETEINENSVGVIFQLIGNSLSDFNVSTSIKTPLDLLENFMIQIASNTKFHKLTHYNEMMLVYNDDSIINSTTNLGENWFKLYADNTWYPFSVEYKFARTIPGFDAFAKLIWNLRKATQTQLGGYLYVGHNLSTGLYLPNNTLTFDTLNKNDNNNEIYHLKGSWNEHEVALYSSLEKHLSDKSTKVNMNYYIELPFRKFQLLFNTSQNVSQNDSTIKLIWGDNTTSCLTLKNERSPGKLVSTLSTGALEHDLILTIDLSKFKELPSIVKAEFEYSNESDKRIQFEIFYNKVIDSIFATERNFIFKHPASKIDYELYFNAQRTSRYSNGSFVVKYRNFETNTPESIQASVKVDNKKFGVLCEVETSKNSFNFEAASTSTDDSLGFLIRTKVNEKDPLRVECTYFYKQISPSINFVASYGDSRRYILYAGLPNEREVTAKLGHELYGEYSLDSLLTMKLNTSQLLWIKILWTKELYPHFYKAILEEYNDLRFVIEATGKELIDVINDDLGKELINDAAEMKQRVLKYATDEKEKISYDIKNSTSFTCGESNYICKKLGDSNIIYYLKTLLGPAHDYFEVAKGAFDKMVGGMLSSLKHGCMVINVQIEKALKDIINIKNIKIDAKDILKKGISDARKSLKEMEVIAVKLLDDFDKYIGYINMKIEEFFDPFLNLLDDLVAYVEQRLALLQIVILDVMDKIQHYIYNLRETKEMLRVYAAYINWLEEIHLTDLLEPIGDVLEDILEKVINDAKKITDHYKPYLDALSEAIFGKYDGINQLPPITEFRELANRFYQKTIWIWHYHNMTEHLKSFIQNISHDIDDILLFIELDENSGDFENHLGLADYVVKPEVGLIEISQPLTFQWEAFNKPPSFQQNRLYQQIQRKMDQFVKIYKHRYNLIDGWRNLVGDISEPAIAPATNNFAMIVGKSHFLTFNNKYFSFTSNCSYLLASDFHMNSFSLVLNFDQSRSKRSFEIITSGASIEITDTYKVLLNKQLVELPLLHNHVTITKEYGNLILESTKGIRMICNGHYDFCTVQLSGWLFGKTAGLLGTLDNEHISDITLPNGTQVADIGDFTNSWKLQKQCASSTKQIIPKQEMLTGLCSVYFRNTASPLSKCFDKVDPSPFEAMCFEDMNAEREVTACSIIAAYRTRCRKDNVDLDMPDLCSRCEEGIGFQEKIFDGHNPKSLDVVFITQQNCFNKEYSVMLPNEINESLIKKGYINNKFASIGYGGKTLTKPHMYTTNNEFWTTSTQLNIKHNDYARWNSKQFKSVDAIKYASNMNFRPGVPKIFILSQCEVTTEMENAPEIYNMLGEKDITLHVLKPNPFGNTSNVIGIDGTSTYPPKKVAEQIIDKIDDVYCGLALSTNGTVFDYDKVCEDSQVASVWASYVTKYVKRSPCQKCKCVSDYNGVGRIDCSRCLNPAVKQFLNEYEANNKMRFSDSGFADAY